MARGTVVGDGDAEGVVKVGLAKVSHTTTWCPSTLLTGWFHMTTGDVGESTEGDVGEGGEGGSGDPGVITYKSQ